MLNRREWLGSMSVAAWPLVRLSADQASGLPAPPAGEPEDEAFWTQVRGLFEPADRINLVTVVRGVSTRATRELVAAESERLNRFQSGARTASELRADIRAKVAAFIGAPASSVALLRNTTEGVTTVLLNWPLTRGDEILTSSAEHGAFYDTLAFRAARDGVIARRFHYPAPAGTSDTIVDAIDRAMTPRTRLVMIGQVVLMGQITPVRAIADRVHARGAALLVDGVLAVGHVETNVTAMDCDFYAAGFHKWGCGPRATAAFYVRPGLVQRLAPLFGAYREDANGLIVPGWSSDAMDKYERFGAHPDAHVYALGDALDLLSRIGPARIQRRLFSLTARWRARADRLPRFRSPVRLDPAHCAGLAAWELEGVERTRVRQVLTDHRLLVGGTEAYGGFFGIPADRPRSLFIANAGLFTSPADVDTLATAIEGAAGL